MPGKVSRRAQPPRRAPRGVRRMLMAAYEAAIAAVDPVGVASLAVTRTRTHVVVRSRGRRAVLSLRDGIVVIGAGKGAAGLAAGVEAVLGDHVIDGLVIVPPGYARPLVRVVVAYGSHPVPDRRSAGATRRLLATLARRPRAAVLVVLTGGASSLLVAPAPGLTLADLRRVNAWLLASGLPIAGMNAVRKHCSAIGGGRLAEMLVGRSAAALVMSDVPGDDLSVIGSGPTVADPTTYADALAAVRASGSATTLPSGVRRHLECGVRGRVAETPKEGSVAARVCPTMLVAGNATARAGTVAWARRAGLSSIVNVRRPFGGDTLAVAAAMARVIRRVRGRLRGSLPALVVAGGETTVRLGANAGKGGRNQALAAALASALDGTGGVALLAAGTDGIDGPTDAAGAFADGGSAERARRAGGGLPEALDRRDVYPALAAIGDLFRPGPTGTNVADLVIALVWKDRGWRLPGRVIQPTGRR